MSTARTSGSELIHSVNNQLAVVVAQAEMLANQGTSEQDRERCREIKQAAANIHQLLRAFFD